MKNVICSILAAIFVSASGQVYADVYDVTSYRYISEDALEYALQGNLSNYAGHYIYYGKEYGIDPIFLAAKDALESGWGTSYQAVNKNNLSGWTSSDGGAMYFETPEDCISHVSYTISDRYIYEPDFNISGYSVYDIGEVYSESEDWAESVAEIMYSIEAKITEYTKN